MMGPVKYDAVTTALRETTGALGVITIVIEGNQGSGFSVQAPASVTLALPALLRHVADGVERDLVEQGMEEIMKAATKEGDMVNSPEVTRG